VTPDFLSIITLVHFLHLFSAYPDMRGVSIKMHSNSAIVSVCEPALRVENDFSEG
jgi:hypothetical protein